MLLEVWRGAAGQGQGTLFKFLVMEDEFSTIKWGLALSNQRGVMAVTQTLSQLALGF